MVADGYMTGRKNNRHYLHEVRVGNVYKSSSTGPRGKSHGTRYWLVVAIRDPDQFSAGGVHLLGIDKNWNIVSTCSYAIWAMRTRPFLYRIKNVEMFALTLKGET
jgi:hypothetical protein